MRRAFICRAILPIRRASFTFFLLLTLCSGGDRLAENRGSCTPEISNGPRARALCGRASKVAHAVRAGAKIIARRRSHELDGEVGGGISSVRAGSARRTFLRCGWASLCGFLSRRYGSDDGTFTLGDRKGGRRAGEARVDVDAAERGCGVCRRGATAAVRVASLAICAERHGREPLCYPHGEASDRTKQDSGL